MNLCFSFVSLTMISLILQQKVPILNAVLSAFNVIPLFYLLKLSINSQESFLPLRFSQESYSQNEISLRSLLEYEY